MIGDHRSAEDYRAVLDPEHARRKLLYRAAAGISVIVLLLLALLLFDETDGAGEVVPEAAGDMPAVVAGLPEPKPFIADPALAPPAAVDAATDGLPPLPTPLHLPGTQAEASADGQTAPGQEGTSSDAASATPPEAASPATVPVEAPPPVARPAAPAPAPTRATRETAQPAAARSALPAVQQSAQGRFQVRLNDYLEMSAANRLRDELAREGLNAELHRHVMVGGYNSRSAADTAMARLKQRQQLSGFVVSTGGRHMVQVGVFSDPTNADKLARTLTAAGYKVVTRGRVVLAGLPDKAGAEQLLAALRTQRRLEGVVIGP